MTSIHEYSICFSTCVTQDGGEQEGLAPTVWSDVHIVTWYVNLIARNQAVGLVLAIKIWIDGRGMTLRRTDRRLVGTLITACWRPTRFLHANTHTHTHTPTRNTAHTCANSHIHTQTDPPITSNKRKKMISRTALVAVLLLAVSSSEAFTPSAQLVSLKEGYSRSCHRFGFCCRCC